MNQKNMTALLESPAPALGAGEMAMFQDLMYRHAGVRLSNAKHTLIQNRLKRRLAETGVKSFAEYYDFVCRPDNTGELRKCLNALTTNETYFFRHKEHWDYIAGTIFPHWLRSHPEGSVFRVWSAAASTGAEAYSTAILLNECLGDRADGRGFAVEATDINQDVLETAKRAEYSPYTVQKISPSGLKKYFEFDQRKGTYKLAHPVAEKVTFRRGNLLEGTKGAPYDLVLLRNVLIYFDEGSKKSVLDNVMLRMRSGCHLFLGGAESMPSERREHFETLKPTIFRKR